MFDLRAFEYQARQMALSIERAAADLRPARMGATVIEHKIYKGNIAGATIGDDGAPAGYPDTHADFGMTVIRFDEVPSGEPIALLVNHGQHPESNDGYDLITADFLAPSERMVERDIGAKLVFSQGDVGCAEGPVLPRRTTRRFPTALSARGRTSATRRPSAARATSPTRSSRRTRDRRRERRSCRSPPTSR